MPRISQFTEAQIAMAKHYAALTPPVDLDPRIEALVNDLIGRVADKWTMLILDVLAERGSCASRVSANWSKASARRCSPRPCVTWSATA